MNEAHREPLNGSSPPDPIPASGSSGPTDQAEVPPAEPPQDRSQLDDLDAFAQRLQVLHHQVADLKELAALDQIPPAQWQELQEQITALETRMQTYLQDLHVPPTGFWQALRFGGLGLLLGVLLQRWLGD